MEKKNKRLNVDIAKSITELESMLKEFRLKKPIYKMFFRGKGLEFDGFREFTPDDDASMIDWKTSSRAQKMIVKRYKEERDLNIIFIVDVGENMVFGSSEKLKCEYVTELVAAFAMVMLNENDKIGFVLFSDRINNYVPAKGGKKQFQIFTELLSNTSTYQGISNLDLALDFSIKSLPKNTSAIILVSDFLRISENTNKKLALLCNKFETIAIRVRDLLDMTLPDINKEIILQSPITGEQVLVNPAIVKKSYERYAALQGKKVREMFEDNNLDYLDLITNKSFAPSLSMFLEDRLQNK
jgi:uncharacterized protein (DUF58 family)